MKIHKRIKNFFSFGLFFLLLAISLSVVIVQTARDAITREALSREQTAVRAAAHSIETFLSLFGESLSLLTAGELNQRRLEGFVESWQGTPIAGVIVTDSAGRVIANANRLKKPDLGASVSDRNYFVWARDSREGAYVVGRPIISRVGASEGKYIVAVAARIMENNQFQGVLAASVIIEELAASYVEPVLVSQKSRFYVIDRNGVIIVSPWPQLTGVNYFDYLAARPFAGSDKAITALRQAAGSPDEGRFTVVLPNEKAGGLTPFLIAHAPVYSGRDDDWWTLSMATPADEMVLPFLVPFKTRLTVGLTVVFLLLVALAVWLGKDNHALKI